MTLDEPQQAAWLDRAFAAMWARSPVDATFVGVQGHDHRLPDTSDAGLGDALARTQSLLREAPGSADERGASHPWLTLDRRLMKGFLEIQAWESESRHFYRGNPSTYAGEAIFGIMGLFLAEFAPLEDRIQWATTRMEGIPAFLAQARTNVQAAPPHWTRRALRECRGGLAFFTDGIARLVREKGLVDGHFVRSAERVVNAFERYRSHLETSVVASHHHAAGEEALARYLSAGHFLSQSPDEVAAYGAAQLAEAQGALRAESRRLGGPDSGALLARLSRLHPTADGYYSAYERAWRKIRALNESADLLTWPDHPIRYVARPDWCRSAAPDLYFLFYRSPSAFRRPPVHDYMVTPVDPSMPQDERQALLRATNDSVILLNHVVHHGGIGHHVQNWHAFRSPSRVGRLAAVDCASRIAMFCGGTMAEGWACYATDLVREAGGLTELECLAELASRRRMCARAVVDVRLHQGRWTLEQAAAFYRERAGMGEAAALGEAVKNSMFPGAAVMYLMGTDAIHALRARMSLLQGAGFSLRAFHDEFLSFGSVPVTLVAREMERRHAASE